MSVCDVVQPQFFFCRHGVCRLTLCGVESRATRLETYEYNRKHAYKSCVPKADAEPRATPNMENHHKPSEAPFFSRTSEGNGGVVVCLLADAVFVGSFLAAGQTGCTIKTDSKMNTSNTPLHSLAPSGKPKRICFR